MDSVETNWYDTTVDMRRKYEEYELELDSAIDDYQQVRRKVSKFTTMKSLRPANDSRFNR